MARSKTTNNTKKKISRKEPATYLARGYSARWLGGRAGANGKPLLQPLTNDEIDQDLRHMNAFWTACQRYQQHAYVALNGIPTGTSEPPQPQQLPIRLDPDHDKRLQAQRQKLEQAEVVREALEQEYVALRAHYVETCQHVQQAVVDKETRLTFLQELATKKAHQLAYLRTRVQVARDIAAALRYRSQLLEEERSRGRTPPSVSTSHNGKDDVLMESWTMLENAAKELGLMSKKGSGGGVIAWKSRVEPSTPRGVPLLVSAASTVPEKSIAWAFDRDPNVSPDLWQVGHKSDDPFVNERPLVFLPNHTPKSIGELLSDDEEDDEDKEGGENSTSKDTKINREFLLKKSSDGKKVVSLRKEVERLTAELEAEEKLNAASVSETAKHRHKLDEWTTMIAILRQETEAVLYRHNVLLSSDEVAPRAKEQWEQQEESERQEEKSIPANIASDEVKQETEKAEEDGSANDGDDEGAEEAAGAEDGGREDGFWNGEGGNTKREAPGESPSSRKRRKV